MAHLADWLTDATPTGSDGKPVNHTGSMSDGDPAFGLVVRPIGGPFDVNVVENTLTGSDGGHAITVESTGSFGLTVSTSGSSGIKIVDSNDVNASMIMISLLGDIYTELRLIHQQLSFLTEEETTETDLD